MTIHATGYAADLDGLAAALVALVATTSVSPRTLAVLCLVAALTACGQPADKTIRAGDQDRYRPTRYRFEEDRVTCYVIQTVGISCVRDAP